MADIVQIQYIGSNGSYQDYSSTDVSLISNTNITPVFGNPGDYIEYFIKDINGNVLSSNYYNSNYSIGSEVGPTNGTTSKITLDPETDVRNAGYDRGSTIVKYNFLTTQIASAPNPTQNFWIEQISNSRTEIKVTRQDLSTTDLSNAFNQFNSLLSVNNFYPDFYLNFGQDKQVIAVNAVFVEDNNGDGHIIFKLYEPLPSEFNIKDTFWVVTKIADPAEFSVTINAEPESTQNTNLLRGPNYKVDIKKTISQVTPYFNYNTLFTTSVTSSYQQLQSMMDDNSISINVDYTNFSNFIHFSSATERLENFVYKLQLIESSSAGLAANNTTSAQLQLQNLIDSTIQKFDGYEYYLYFSSESFAWPKSSATQPYTLYSVSSSQSQNWLGSPTTVPSVGTASLYYSSSLYDSNNPDLLQYASPSYVLDDDRNLPYLTFLNMIGQHFDNIWIYLKDVTNRYSAENNPNIGISMDQVGDALKSLGFNLYTNTSISDNIYHSLFGINPDGSLLPPTGSEIIKTYVTASVPTLPAQQITDQVYKRLYHNLIYLLKTKGTERGVRALIATYGIPNNILHVNEFGGYDIGTISGIQGINNNKVLTSSINTINSTVLSPNTTIQYYNNNTQKSSIDLEIGFSPSDFINANITSSGLVTSSAQPGYFNIMQYIGDPNLQYSSSYVPLDTLKNTYFTANYITGNNVWDYIRVIKYYNNSLFKTLSDFVPARSSMTSGIIVKSHILERNKYPRHEPTATTSSNLGEISSSMIYGDNGASITGSTAYLKAIKLQYNGTSSAAFVTSSGTIYVSSSNNIEQYTGELSGTEVFVGYSSSFDQNEVSNYNYYWSSSVPLVSGSGNMFVSYSLGALYQNVTASVISQQFLELDYNGSQLSPTNYGLVTQSLSQSLVIGAVSQSVQKYSQYAQIQDYNYNAHSLVNLKYSGSTLSGQYYNVYTPGDITLGNNPVINYYTSRLGLFSQIVTSSYFPSLCNAKLVYLADVSGGLYELNQNNISWEDIQNTFILGQNTTVKLFNNQQYGNQKSTDGVKSIYSSGYSYTPTLYFLTGSTNDSALYFLGTSTATTAFIADNGGAGGSNYFISGSPNPTYSASLVQTAYGIASRSGSIFNVFDTLVQGNATNTGFTVGSLTGGTFPTYSAVQAGQQTFTVNLPINLQFPSAQLIGPQSGSFSFSIFYNTNTLLGRQAYSFTSSYTPASTNNGTITTTSYPGYSTITLIGTVNYYTGPFSGYAGSNNTSTVGVQYYYNSAGSGGGQVVVSTSGPGLSGITPYNGLNAISSTFISSITSATTTPAVDNKSTTFNFNFTTPAQSFAVGDKAVFRLVQENMSTASFTASIGVGSLSLGTISLGSGGYPYATASVNAGGGPFIDSISVSNVLYYTNASDLILGPNLSQYEGYTYIPYFTSGSTVVSSSLYSTYGPVNYPFNPQEGDAIVLSDGFNTQLLTVYSSSLSSSLSTGVTKLRITVTPPIISSFQNNPSSINRMLVLKRYDDEQNVILNFNQTPGQTSYGFLIPNNINPTVLQNINSLQSSIINQLVLPS